MKVVAVIVAAFAKTVSTTSKIEQNRIHFIKYQASPFREQFPVLCRVKIHFIKCQGSPSRPSAGELEFEPITLQVISNEVRDLLIHPARHFLL